MRKTKQNKTISKMPPCIFIHLGMQRTKAHTHKATAIWQIWFVCVWWLFVCTFVSSFFVCIVHRVWWWFICLFVFRLFVFRWFVRSFVCTSVCTLVLCSVIRKTISHFAGKKGVCCAIDTVRNNNNKKRPFFSLNNNQSAPQHFLSNNTISSFLLVRIQPSRQHAQTTSETSTTRPSHGPQLRLLAFFRGVSLRLGDCCIHFGNCYSLVSQRICRPFRRRLETYPK